MPFINLFKNWETIIKMQKNTGTEISGTSMFPLGVTGGKLNG